MELGIEGSVELGRIYIAGPMTGRDLMNFPAFDEARDRLGSLGWDPVSPADLDRGVGFDPEVDEVDRAFLEEAMRRDLEALMEVDAIVMLPGWEGSTGARAEYGLARWRRIPVFRYPEMVLIEESREEDVLEEALQLTGGDRMEDYGHPADDFARVAGMWGALKGVEFEAHEVAMFMACLKLSRMVQSRGKRDHWVDLAGYARCGHLCVTGAPR